MTRPLLLATLFLPLAAADGPELTRAAFHQLANRQCDASGADSDAGGGQ